MQISGYGAVSQTQWPYEQQKRTRAVTETAGLLGDTVSFSAEALELLAQSQAAKADTVKAGDSQADTRDSSGSKSDAKAESGKPSVVSMTAKGATSSGNSGGFDDTAGEQAEEKAAGGVGQQSSQDSTETDIDAKIKSLKGQIEQIARQVGQIYAASTDPRVKEETAKPLEGRIGQLEQEIQTLEAQKAEKAAAAQK